MKPFRNSNLSSCRIMLTWLLISVIPYGMVVPWTPYICNYQWLYIDSMKTAFICNSWKDNTYTIAHETGHYVWFQLYTDKERKWYLKLYQKAFKKGIGAFPTAYAMTNVEESFAEDYARWKLSPNSIYWQARISYLKKVWK